MMMVGGILIILGVINAIFAAIVYFFDDEIATYMYIPVLPLVIVGIVLWELYH